MAFDGITRVFPQSRASVQQQQGQSDSVGNLLLDIRDAATPAPLGDAVQVVVGSGQTVLTAPAKSVAFKLNVESGDFLMRQGDQDVRTLDALPVSGESSLTISGHGYGLVDGPVHMFSTGDHPDPLGVASGMQFVRSIDVDTVRLFDTRADAQANTNPVVFTSAGTGTLTLGEVLATPGFTEFLVGNSPITVTSGNTERFHIAGGAEFAQSITVKGSAAGARLTAWFLG